jgi:hypothetical protein
MHKRIAQAGAALMLAASLALPVLAEESGTNTNATTNVNGSTNTNTSTNTNVSTNTNTSTNVNAPVAPKDERKALLEKQQAEREALKAKLKAEKEAKAAAAKAEREAKRAAMAACMKPAIDKRDTAISAAVDAFATSSKAVLSTRKAALMAAWDLTDVSARRTALSAAWKASREGMSSARKGLRDAKANAWKQFSTDRKACGGQGEDSSNSSLDANL